MTIKSWNKWKPKVYKTRSINRKGLGYLHIYKDDRIVGCKFNGDESVELLIERDHIYLDFVYVRHRKEMEEYKILREDIIRVVY